MPMRGAAVDIEEQVSEIVPRTERVPKRNSCRHTGCDRVCHSPPRLRTTPN